MPREPSCMRQVWHLTVLPICFTIRKAPSMRPPLCPCPVMLCCAEKGWWNVSESGNDLAEMLHWFAGISLVYFVMLLVRVVWVPVVCCWRKIWGRRNRTGP